MEVGFLSLEGLGNLCMLTLEQSDLYSMFKLEPANILINS
jgi:hypothetical protein